MRWMMTPFAAIGPILCVLLVGFLVPSAGISQEVIKIQNGSFEAEPRAGGIQHAPPIPGWEDCGVKKFPTTSPVDIHPHPDAWQVDGAPAHGKTFLGLVVRNNDTWESVGQELSSPMLPGVCYQLDLSLMRSTVYMGLRDYSGPADEPPRFMRPFLTPVVVRIWGGNDICDKQALLAESEMIDHTSWEVYHTIMRPKERFQYLLLEAFYKTPTIVPYNGHVLIDNLSDLVPVNCHD
ncbi:MAG: hypothetical protein R3301_04395 [Saprospiraceae bacterium]|nr:hypothetical protein [Saprospiraceae bacterium]